MEISPPVAIVLGACIGAASSTLGTFISNLLVAKREKAKWQIEKRAEVYSNSLRYLTRVLNRRTAIDSSGKARLEKQSTTEWLNDLCEAQIWLSSLQIYCSRKHKKKIQSSLDKLSYRIKEFMDNAITTAPMSPDSDTETLSFAQLIHSVYMDIYNCACEEFS